MPLAATVPARPDHRAALGCLADGFRARAHCLSGQVLREYLAVSTRTIAVNGLGLTPSQALANVHQFGTRATLLPEDASVHARLLELLTEVGAASPQVHDANIVATMPAHGVRELVTLNPCDFERYVPRIGLQAP